jgi:hypothetical protein
LRRADPDPGTVTDHVHLIKQVDYVETEFEAAQNSGFERLYRAQTDLLIPGQAGAVGDTAECGRRMTIFSSAAIVFRTSVVIGSPIVPVSAR